MREAAYANWHAMDANEVLAFWDVDPQEGLEEKEALWRREKYGSNRLREKGQQPLWTMFLAQFKDFMVITLLAATLISGLLGETADAIAILAIVLLNGLLGFVQERRAERSLKALKKLTVPEALVLRDGEERKIPAEEVVPGDIVKLEAGSRVPADLRLLETVSMEAEEAVLTGESMPVAKNASLLFSGETALADRKNMVFMGTVISRGRGIGVAVATGMNTELGRVVGMIQEAEEGPTPLQRRLEHLGKVLLAGCLVICAIVTGVGIKRGEPFYAMFLTGVSLAVAAIPEGLPAVVTVSLAVGVQRMIRRQAIVRRLKAVETLGCATVICSDKTGTLTKNEMTVRKLYVNGKTILVSGEGYSPGGDFFWSERRLNREELAEVKELAKAGALCNNARLYREMESFWDWFKPGQKEKGWKISGDPTEGALLVLAEKAGMRVKDLAQREKRIGEIPFEAERKMMSVACRDERGGYRVYVKGAPEVVARKCSRVWKGGEAVKWEEKEREKVLQVNTSLAREALRVLAVAFRELSEEEVSCPDCWEKELTFLGLAGMIDPPRPAVQRAAETAFRAGIKTVMITGDHPATALAVAREIGIACEEREVLAGSEMEALSDAALREKAKEIAVYARVSPVHKVRIVRALKQQGHIVAMTGDGVNDAPALKEADIGIAMGKSGTDVTREAADIVLVDDNYATIVAAIEEGRAIYDNIRKFIRYLLGCNIGEVLLMFAAPLLGFPLPLLPLQILWVNLVTDGLPAIALGVDPPDKDLMDRPPRQPQESIFARGLGKEIIVRGIEIGLATLLVYALGCYWGGSGETNLPAARTMAFCTLVFMQLFYVFECRSESRSLLETGIKGNPYLLLAIAVSASMQIMAVSLPFLRPIFGAVPLQAEQWGLVLTVSALPTLAILLRSLAVKIWRRSFLFFRVRFS